MAKVAGEGASVDSGAGEGRWPEAGREGNAMSCPERQAEPMSRADMVTLESALRNGWPVPEVSLQAQLRRVQAVLDDPCSNDCARWRARRVLELARGRLAGQGPDPQQ
jgi:hypothetical protein